METAVRRSGRRRLIVAIAILLLVGLPAYLILGSASWGRQEPAQGTAEFTSGGAIRTSDSDSSPLPRRTLIAAPLTVLMVRVVDAQGVPLVDAEVRLEPATSTEEYELTHVRDGTYRGEAPPGVSFDLRVTADRHAPHRTLGILPAPGVEGVRDLGTVRLEPSAPAEVRDTVAEESVEILRENGVAEIRAWILPLGSLIAVERPFVKLVVPLTSGKHVVPIDLPSDLRWECRFFAHVAGTLLGSPLRAEPVPFQECGDRWVCEFVVPGGDYFITGRTVDGAGRPVPLAKVYQNPLGPIGQSDDLGRFALLLERPGARVEVHAKVGRIRGSPIPLTGGARDVRIVVPTDDKPRYRLLESDGRPLERFVLAPSLHALDHLRCGGDPGDYPFHADGVVRVVVRDVHAGHRWFVLTPEDGERTVVLESVPAGDDPPVDVVVRPPEPKGTVLLAGPGHGFPKGAMLLLKEDPYPTLPIEGRGYMAKVIEPGDPWQISAVVHGEYTWALHVRTLKPQRTGTVRVDGDTTVLRL